MLDRRHFARFLLGAAGAAVLAGTAAAQAYPPGYAPVPPPRYEPVPPPAGPGLIWAPGHWVWDGHRYVWVRGVFVHRRHAWHRWIDGHWVPRGGTWVWVPGHWA